VQHAQGSAAVPGITFTGDTNTGIYSPEADQVAISTNGTGRLFVTSAGLLGVGTSVPQSTLHIQGTTSAFGNGSASLFWGDTSAVGGLTYSGTTAIVQASSGSGALAFYRGSTEMGRFDSSGNVGISTSNPRSRLDLGDGTTGANQISWHNNSTLSYGNIWQSFSGGKTIIANGLKGSTAVINGFQSSVSGLYAKSAIEQGSGAITFFTNAADTVAYGTAYTPTERMRIDSSGNVGIGAPPLVPLDIRTAQGTLNLSAGSDPVVNLNILNPDTTIGTGPTVAFSSYYSSTNAGPLATIAVLREVGSGSGVSALSNSIVISQAQTSSPNLIERLRVDSSGGLLVGTSNAVSVNGVTAQHAFSHGISSQWAAAVQHTTAAGNVPFGLAIQYTAATPNNASSDFLWCQDAASLRFTVRSNGGITNPQANNVNLSDRNTKKDISPAVGTWDCIKEWEIVNYRYKDQPDDADLNLGVIAQQVAESCPEVIAVFQEAKEATEDQPAQEERLGVKEQQMYWMAIKALQEAQARIEALEARLTTAGIK
jgi:hypothetical protein